MSFETIYDMICTLSYDVGLAYFVKLKIYALIYNNLVLNIVVMLQYYGMHLVSLLCIYIHAFTCMC